MPFLKGVKKLRTFVSAHAALGHRIEELGPLNQLRGQLSIRSLEHVRDKKEARGANLVEKDKIYKLRFYWSKEREGNGDNDEEVLEGLQPHQYLKSLTIQNYQGKKFPSWMLTSSIARDGFSLFDNLIEIILSGCSECEVLPTLGLLPCLKVLEISDMDNLRCIDTEFYSNYNDGSYKNVLFPALKRLILWRLPNLVEWKDATESTETGMVFPCLEELIIELCNQLESAPCHFPSLKKLNIFQTCSRPFENICSKLTTLVSLSISNILELASLPEQLLQNNCSLNDLKIQSCANLESISPHENVFCTSLRSLKIKNCTELSYLLHNLISLEELIVVRCPNLKSFPSIEIQDVASFLQRLEISECGVEALPTGLQLCTSLQELKIEGCPNLISIADLGEELHSLTELRIYNCPNLILIADLLELRSLKNLGIFDCPKLTGLSEGLLDCLTHLKSLEIGGYFEVLDAFPSLNSIQHSHDSLEILYLHGWSKLNSLPDKIQHFISLKYLYIYEFDGMEVLPEWLGNLSSLQYLSLNSCKNLMKLPTAQAMRCLRLEKLEIWCCPKLNECCAKGSGPEWLNSWNEMLKVLFKCCNRFNQETLQITKNGRYFGIACPKKKGKEPILQKQSGNRFIHGCYPIGEGAHMYNLQTSSGLGERARGEKPRTGIGSKSSWIVGLEVEGVVGELGMRFWVLRVVIYGPDLLFRHGMELATMQHLHTDMPRLRNIDFSSLSRILDT
nr:disease resistance protein rga2 [Quercus suber]